MNRAAPLSRQTPLKQRKPLRKGRMRRTPQKRRLPAVRRYWDWLSEDCVACGALDARVHHILADAPGKIKHRDDMLVARLCPLCHNMGTKSVHLLGSEEAFRRETGVDLVAIAVRNRDAWEALQ